MVRLLPGSDDPHDAAWSLLLESALEAWEVLRERVATLELSAPQAKLLLHVGRGPLRMSQLADQLGYDRSTVTDMCDRLERDGLVVRAPDPVDRRTRVVDLTDQGRARHRALVALLEPAPGAVRRLGDDVASRLARDLARLGTDGQRWSEVDA